MPAGRSGTEPDSSNAVIRFLESMPLSYRLLAILLTLLLVALTLAQVALLDEDCKVDPPTWRYTPVVEWKMDSFADDPDFQEQMAEQLRHTPWLGLSLALHALAEAGPDAAASRSSRTCSTPQC